MRVSIASLTVLAICACRALFAAAPTIEARQAPVRANLLLKKGILGALLLIGAITPLHEFARAAALEPWAANRDATLIDAACGSFPPHYIARLHGQRVAHLLRPPHALSVGQAGPDACANPASRMERLRAENPR
jgi:hypothetical protein